MAGKKGKIIIVVGGQYGSEAKGLYVEKLALSQQVDVHVRTGAINAGHTIYYNGEKFAMQTVPCGWIDPEAKLVLGAGAYIEPKHLNDELEMIEKATGSRIGDRLIIDFKAGWHDALHVEAEQNAKMHERFGSTAHGCMAASVEKMQRKADYRQFSQTGAAKELQQKFGFKFADTALYLNEIYDRGGVIMLEGTQGTSLDLLHGDYPFTTSRSTIAANWMMEAGLSPALNVEVIMVCRTLPIRVAGNSGPLPGEIEWVTLARDLNDRRAKVGMPPVVAPDALETFGTTMMDLAESCGLPNAFPSTWSPAERAAHSEALVNFHKLALEKVGPEVESELRKFFEITTVTKKLRRIAQPDFGVLRRNVLLNRPEFLVLNFVNYLFPSVEGCTTLDELKRCKEWPEVKAYAAEFGRDAGAPVRFLGLSRYDLVDLGQ